MKNKEDEARRVRDEQRRIEAEKMKYDTMTELNPPLRASIPILTPNMFNVPKVFKFPNAMQLVYL